MNTNKSAEVPERLGCGHSKRRPGGTLQPAGEPRAAGLERPGNGSRYLVRKDQRGACGGRVMAYKSVVIRCRCVSCANGRTTRRRRSPWLTSSLKPYWGKPAVRNFRGGGGNVCKVWRLFATQLERADTSEADRPTQGAPLLHSTKRRWACCRTTRPGSKPA